MQITPWSCASLVLIIVQVGGGPSVDGFYLGTFTRANRTLEVGVTLTTESNALTGTYFYFGSEGEIKLAGTRGAGQAIRLDETTVDGRMTGRWEGKLVGSGLEGVWTSASGQQWIFRLRRVEQAAQFEGPVGTLETGTGRIAFRTARVPASDHRVPLITDFRDPRVMTEINSVVMSAANNARCAAGVIDDTEFEAAISFAGADMLSVRVTQSWFCQAAYPTIGEDRSMVFDLRTGNGLDVDDLFRKDVSPERMFAVLFPYELSRKQTGSPPITSGDDDRECHDVWSPKRLAEDGLHPWFHLTAEGIVVQLQLPHVVAACANAVTVPYSAVGPIALPEGPLARLAAANAGKPMRYRIHRPRADPAEDIFFTPSAK